MKKSGHSSKKKTPAEQDAVVSGKILEKAKQSLATDRLALRPKAERCVVCGSDVAPNSTEQLCWVCRRLKISAWMENDQMPAQE